MKPGWWCVAPLSLLGSGCFLVQAAGGQLDLLRRARPIDEALADPRLDSDHRRLLGEVWRIKRWGEGLGLEPTRSYERFADLDRDSVVWVVSACQPLAFEPKTWRFPIVGSFTYISWFDQADAARHASELGREGWEVYVRGASAYSTVGWFRDPVLSTMLGAEDTALGYLVNVILHESVHATVYVNGQSPFNESLASFVADALTPSYLGRWHGSEQVAIYQAWQRRAARRRDGLHEVYTDLAALYASKISDDDKRRRKGEIIDLAKRRLGLQDLNNARLIQYRTYDTGKQAFAALLDSCGGDWRRLLVAVARLGPSDFPEPHTEELEAVLLRLGCG